MYRRENCQCASSSPIVRVIDHGGEDVDLSSVVYRTTRAPRPETSLSSSPAQTRSSSPSYVRTPVESRRRISSSFNPSAHAFSAWVAAERTTAYYNT